jgi:hypothetical protein
MEMFKFYIQDVNDRAKIALNEGKHICSRQGKRHRIELYYLDNYFIEVCYKKDSDKVSAVRGFRDLDLLDPYL